MRISILLSFIIFSISMNGVVAADTTRPVMKKPPNLTAEATSSSGAVVTFTIPATDNSGIAPTVTCTPSSGSNFPLGSTTVRCRARDTSGNVTSRKFTITVMDRKAPTLSLPSDIKKQVPGTSETIKFNAFASDLVDGNVSVSCLPASGSVFLLGKFLSTIFYLP